MNNTSLPNQWDLSNLSKQLGLRDSTEVYSEIENTKEDLESKYSHVGVIKVILIILGFLLLMYFIGIILWLVAWLVYGKNGARVKSLQESYNQADQELQSYIQDLGNKISMQVFNLTPRYVGIDEKGVFYTNSGFIYIDIANNKCVGYTKSNIKEVTRERLHTGSHTDSNTAGSATGYTTSSGIGFGVGSANTSADTSEFYEWHFDIMTDYYPEPRVSLVIPDSTEAENAISNAYAVLKP